MIFTNQDLATMIKARPQGMSKLGTVNGIGKAKLDKHGQKILALLAWPGARSRPRRSPRATAVPPPRRKPRPRTKRPPGPKAATTDRSSAPDSGCQTRWFETFKLHAELAQCVFPLRAGVNKLYSGMGSGIVAAAAVVHRIAPDAVTVWVLPVPFHGSSAIRSSPRGGCLGGAWARS